MTASVGIGSSYTGIADGTFAGWQRLVVRALESCVAGAEGWAAVYVVDERHWTLLASAGSARSVPGTCVSPLDRPPPGVERTFALGAGPAPCACLVVAASEGRAHGAGNGIPLEAGAAHLTNLLESWLLFQEAMDSAVRDSLSGVYNRRYFDDALPKAVADSRRFDERLALIYIDIDDFKAINDSRGHEAGDQVLIDVSASIAASVRASDAVARIGGEEFAVIMPNTDQAAARAVAERIRAAVERTGVIPVTISLGVACVPLDADSTEELRRRADEALYWAKRSGKNVAICAAETQLAHVAEHDRVQSELVHRIVRGALAPGLRLEEMTLAAELECTRSTLRQVLVALRGEGLLLASPGGGFDVAPLTAEEVTELFPLVGALEALALRESRPSSSCLRDLARLNERIMCVGSAATDRIELDELWHNTLLATCANRQLLRLVHNLKRRNRRYQYAFMGNTRTMTTSVDQHAAILDALLQGDVDTAADALCQNWTIGVAPLVAVLSS